MVYKTSGVCSSEIHVKVEDKIIQSVSFVGGCSGNLQGIARLVEGMQTEDAIAKIEGIKCGYKNTSCPDQLARALKKFI